MTNLSPSLKVQGDGIYSVSEIVDRIEARLQVNKAKWDYDKLRKARETWVGQTIRQFKLFEGSEHRKNRKRAYEFKLDRVQDVLGRYEHPSS